MSKLQDLINKLCPNGVEYKYIKDTFKRLKGTPITAGKMKEIENVDGEIRIFAGGKTIINAKEEDIPKANITRVPAVLVQSRGIIDFIYYEKPFTFKNEMWAYTTEDKVSVKFLYYVLKNNLSYFRDASSGMGSMPQISLRITEDFMIPVPPLEVQREIVRILDSFTKYTTELITNLITEIEVQKKQYEYYQDLVLTFVETGNTILSEQSRAEQSRAEQSRAGIIKILQYVFGWIEVELGDIIDSLTTGLNPRQFFKLNTDDAQNYYVTIRELHNNTIIFSDKTDRINDEALTLCNNRSNLEIGDVLFSGTGTIGETAVIMEKPDNWNIKEGVYAIKPKKNIVNSKFLMYLLRTQETHSNIMKKVTGGTVKSISMKEMKKLKIVIPSITEQEYIVSILEHFDALCNDITTSFLIEIEARKKQYEYYRDKLLTFKELNI